MGIRLIFLCLWLPLVASADAGNPPISAARTLNTPGHLSYFCAAELKLLRMSTWDYYDSSEIDSQDGVVGVASYAEYAPVRAKYCRYRVAKTGEK